MLFLTDVYLTCFYSLSPVKMHTFFTVQSDLFFNRDFFITASLDFSCSSSSLYFLATKRKSVKQFITFFSAVNLYKFENHYVPSLYALNSPRSSSFPVSHSDSLVLSTPLLHILSGK